MLRGGDAFPSSSPGSVRHMASAAWMVSTLTDYGEVVGVGFWVCDDASGHDAVGSIPTGRPPK